VVRLIDPAVDDLRALLRLDPQIVRWALKKLLLLERNPEAGKELHGSLIGWRKLTVSDRDWRIVWRVASDDTGTVIVDVAEVWAVGARADREVYEETTHSR
jgi:mRNA interferase RelE/StbE